MIDYLEILEELKSLYELLDHLDPFLLRKIPNGIADLLIVRSQDARNIESFVAINEELGCNTASQSNRLGHARKAFRVTVRFESGGGIFLQKSI